MATFTEKTEYTYTIDTQKRILVRQENVVLRDNEEVSRTFVRHVVSPGANLSNETAEVKTLAADLWTEGVVEEYQRKEEAVMQMINQQIATPEEVVDDSSTK